MGPNTFLSGTLISNLGFFTKQSLKPLICDVQLNLFQKFLFLHQLTRNLTTDCSLNYKFST